VLAVQARQLRDPVTERVLMEPHDGAPDRTNAGAGVAPGVDEGAAGLTDVLGPARRVATLVDHESSLQ
jgi:hypothetical protein